MRTYRGTMAGRDSPAPSASVHWNDHNFTPQGHVMSMSSLARQARNEGKAVYHRERAADYRRDAAEAEFRGNAKGAEKLNSLAAQEEARSNKLCAS